MLDDVSARERLGHGPFVPVGVKDIIDVLGLPTRMGTTFHDATPVHREGGTVSLLREAGCVMVGKTVTTELGHRHPGPTRNPRNLGHTPGGSSSGSAAAVADAMVPLALGTQTSGSVIRPAAYCGVVGYKPTLDDFDRSGILANAPSMDTLGVFARCVDDIALVRAMLVDGQRREAVPALLADLSFALLEAPPWQEASSDTREQHVRLAGTLTSLGATRVDVALHAECERLLELHRLISGYEFRRSIAFERIHHLDDLSEVLRNGRLADGDAVTHADYRRALGEVVALRAAVARAFETVDIIISAERRRAGTGVAGVDRQRRLQLGLDAGRQSGHQPAAVRGGGQRPAPRLPAGRRPGPGRAAARRIEGPRAPSGGRLRNSRGGLLASSPSQPAATGGSEPFRRTHTAQSRRESTKGTGGQGMSSSTPSRRTRTICGLAASAVLVAGSGYAAAADPVRLRWASDHSGPPHPAAIAEVYFAERVEERIPGSKVQIYWAKSLYTIPQGVKAMTQGNLEMITGQWGKTASVEPLSNVLLGAGKLTTVGAIDGVDSTETFAALVDHFDARHDITIFGAGHLSMYMGAGAVKSRLVSPADFAGKKMRSMGPAENALLSALDANPQSMAFGDVPPALQTGVIDGLLTSLGGFNAVKEQAPYFTVAGLNGIVGDYYWFGASNRWWSRLSAEQQEILTDIVKNDFIPFQRAINYCNDQRTLNRFVTEDKSAPGIYVMNETEAAAIKTAEGGATNEWIKSKVDDTGDQLVDKFVAEAAALVESNPPGSHPLEQTDCAEYETYFERYGKGGELYKAKNRK